jgi:hypothetical protein
MCLISASAFAQDIINTLGPGGKFIVKEQSINSMVLGENNNISLGTFSLISNTTGSGNIALGHWSLAGNTEGLYNVAIGLQSTEHTTTGYANSALGLNSLQNNTTGNCNTAIGSSSLRNNDNGSSNTALGYYAGSDLVSGNNVTCLGYGSQPTSASVSNQITLGDNYITSLRCNVTTITSLSDTRDKKNIKDLDLGIDFLMKIKPRQFNWDKREWYEQNISDGSKIKETPTAGFIAQELDEAQTTENAEWLNLVLKDNPEKWEATPGNLLPIIVKAIQELKAENEMLKGNNEKLLKEIASLKSMNEKLAKLEQTINEMSSSEKTSFSLAK